MNASTTQDNTLRELINLGEALLMNGAEVNRVEDTLIRMGKAAGAESINVFVITSDIVATIRYPDGSEITQTRRINHSASVNFGVIEKLNALSRKFCISPISDSELHEKIESILTSKPRTLIKYAGNIIAAIAFAVFFGGGFAECVAAAVAALIIAFLSHKVAPYLKNTIIFNFSAAFILGIFLTVSSHFFPIFDCPKAFSGALMLLIPGVAITNSVRDMLVGDTMSGILHLIESVLWAGAIVVGYVLAAYLTEVIL